MPRAREGSPVGENRQQQFSMFKTMVQSQDAFSSEVSAVNSAAETIRQLDNQLSNRFIELDPAGYFIISLDRETGEICADHYGNNVNEQGLATDPETGEVLSCKGDLKRVPTAQYRGRSAKEIGMKLTEEADPCPLSKLDHALYLGREFVRAELALLAGTEYVQD